MLPSSLNGDPYFVSTFKNLSDAALELQTNTCISTSILDFIGTWKKLASLTTRTGNLISLKMLLKLLNNLSDNKCFFRLLKGEIWRYYGIINLLTGNYLETLHYFEERFNLLNLEENPDSYFEARLDLAEIFLLLRRLPQAEEQLILALKASPNNLTSFQEAQIYNRFGRLYLEWGQWQKGQANLRRASLLLQNLETNIFVEQEELKLEQAFTLHWVGVNAHRSGNFKEAEKLLWQSLQISYKFHNLIELTETMNLLGLVYKEMGLIDAALISLEGSLAMSQQLQYIPALLKAYHNKALSHFENSNFQEALVAARYAVELGLESGQPLWSAKAFIILGKIYHNLGDNKLALACYLKTVEQYTNDTNPEWIEILIEVGDYLLGLDKVSCYREKALELYRIALELIEENQRLEYLAPTLGKMGFAFTKINGLGGLEDARRCYQLQLRLAGDLDNTILEPAFGIKLRVEAIMGLLRCSALKSNPNYKSLN